MRFRKGTFSLLPFSSSILALLVFACSSSNGTIPPPPVNDAGGTALVSAGALATVALTGIALLAVPATVAARPSAVVPKPEGGVQLQPSIIGKDNKN